ncbi:four helix bundle protein [Candidatus Roizmanbacteria bacterium CG22_combo_CG10-13_8_21_14_all_35_9]|uniref:Four helix bundle protein n=1 Tax=Candidatus Roizmanbacteria bacterium CG22_combo_CG10-13_8_21_14_all_35_9 TaxID=1974861 RepID=A0A2H0BYM6_9BACT|nr:MAG: four helix bundle protein [Candidatus Roizmanbacteria bacterium CG22_combo_CG10-13_8_21_14_all_35_9]
MKNYDLEDRTKSFSIKIIHLCKKLPFNTVNHRLIDQLIRSSTSIGANYREANETDTKKDFKNKITIAKKEVKETIYWLELILEANSGIKDEMFSLLDESKQLIKILASIYDKINV